LLPAVQKVREAANRMKCTNNLKNLGLALHTFLNVRGKFPPSRAEGPFPEAGITATVIHGWGPFLLPYLEQEALARLYRWDLAPQDAGNQPVSGTHLKILQCPSTEPNRAMTYSSWSTDRQGACTDYSPTQEVDPVLAQMGLIDAVGMYQGVLSRNFMTRPSDILDGTSNTTLMAEDAGRPRQWRAGRPGPDQTVGGGPWTGPSNQLIIQGSTADGTTRPGPCPMNCTNNLEIYSVHPGGANALFADGAVHFLSAGMSIRVLARLVTRAGGEIVSGNYF
jgi:prepilin-type processing-associated H-X9-DG protein